MGKIMAEIVKKPVSKDCTEENMHISSHSKIRMLKVSKYNYKHGTNYRNSTNDSRQILSTRTIISEFKSLISKSGNQTYYTYIKPIVLLCYRTFYLFISITSVTHIIDHSEAWTRSLLARLPKIAGSCSVKLV